MATKTSWHRYGSKLRHFHAMYSCLPINFYLLTVSVSVSVIRVKQVLAMHSCQSDSVVQMTLRRVHSTWTEVNWPTTSRPNYTTYSLVTRVTVTIWLAAVKLGLLVLSEFWLIPMWLFIFFRNSQFSTLYSTVRSRTEMTTTTSVRYRGNALILIPLGYNA